MVQEAGCWIAGIIVGLFIATLLGATLGPLIIGIAVAIMIRTYLHNRFVRG